MIKMQDEKECYLCGRSGNLESHHCIAGTANRRLSEKYGLKVWLCNDCHTGKGGAQYDAKLGLRLKQDAQRAFEKEFGHEKWMQVFMKNYL